MTNVSAASGRARSGTSRAWMPIRSRTSSRSRNGRRAAVDGDREGVVVGRAVALVEGVDPLLDPDAGGIRAVAVVDVALGDRVRGGVDVEGEGRDAVLVGVDERVDARVLVGDAVVGRGRGRRRGAVVGRWCCGVGRLAYPAASDELRAAAGGRHEGDGGQGQDRLAHGATSLREPVGTPGRHGRGRRSGPAGPGSVATKCAVGPPR